MKNGTLFGVGVGPGDPELLTLKAVRILSEADIIAVPDTGKSEKAAYSIVEAHIKGKEILECPTPMVRDKKQLNESYEEAAEKICALLEAGKNVAFITLGDPTVYSTYIYVHKRVLAHGFNAELIPGVPSFCAVAARLNIPLCEGAEPLVIIPASYDNLDECIGFPGNKVLMKAGKTISALRDKLKSLGYGGNVSMVSNCGMENEKVCRGVDEIDENAGYFSIVVVKE